MDGFKIYHAFVPKGEPPQDSMPFLKFIEANPQAILAGFFPRWFNPTQFNQNLTEVEQLRSIVTEIIKDNRRDLAFKRLAAGEYKLERALKVADEITKTSSPGNGVPVENLISGNMFATWVHQVGARLYLETFDISDAMSKARIHMLEAQARLNYLAGCPLKEQWSVEMYQRVSQEQELLGRKM